MEPIKIGKFTLESLTTGMYADPRIIFREYIQNATDAIDKAIKSKILKVEDARIDISSDKRLKKITVKDNGIGIENSKVWHLLGDIGNSEKYFEENRGFRGIGRLGGLSYASELQFITSAKGENIKTTVYWDCKKLRELLQPGKFLDYDLTKVMDEISCITMDKEDKEKHYFEVILDGVDGEKYPELLDSSNIDEYLSQVAPVPFNAQRFPYYADAKDGILIALKGISKPLEEYYIYLNGNPNPIYKPYKTWFTADEKKDSITGLNFFKGHKSDKELLFWGWYAKTNWLGTIDEPKIKGLRIRKGNIQIGNENTLSDFFTETRFNGWFIGEVYVYDKNIIPNARRDYFEINEEYQIFKDELEKITRQELSRLPKKYSKERTERKNIEEAKKTVVEAEQTLEKGFTSEIQREELFKKLDAIKHKIKPKEKNKKEQPTDRPEIEKEKDKIHSKLIAIENKIIDADIYRIKDVPSSYSKEVRKVISKIFEIIDSTLQKEEAEKLIDNIIETLQKKPKNNKKK